MYDMNRFKNYDIKDCRFPACSEIRAANLDGICSEAFSYVNFFHRSNKNKKMMENCIKKEAINYTTYYYDHCKSKAVDSVNDVFEKCYKDISPIFSDKLKI